MSLPTYPEYKDSGIAWIGGVPAHWCVRPLVHIATERSEPNLGMQENNLLSLSYGRIVQKDIEANDGLLPESFETYQIVRKGDIVLRLTDLQNDKRSLRSAQVGQRGIITSAYLALKPTGVDSNFLSYLLRAYDLTKVFYSMGGGLRQSMKFADLKRMPIVVPSEPEQSAIAAFLDRETAKIDALIAEQEKLLALLAEKRQATISHAVTRGLDPNVPMKDSGIPWLGQVPAHWEVIAIKQLSPVQRGASPRPIDDPKYFDEEGVFSWVRISDVSASDGYLRTTEQTLSELGASLSVKLEPGALFVSIAGSVGKPCISTVKVCIHDGFVYFPMLSIPPKFLFRIFEAGNCYAGLGKMGTQLNLNTDTIGSIRIALPPDSELIEVLDHLDRSLLHIDELRAKAERAISLLKERRNAIIAAAVTGQIDVRGAVEGMAA
jgi:type I restriction enzyme S subunit